VDAADLDLQHLQSAAARKAEIGAARLHHVIQQIRSLLHRQPVRLVPAVIRFAVNHLAGLQGNTGIPYALRTVHANVKVCTSAEKIHARRRYRWTGHRPGDTGRWSQRPQKAPVGLPIHMG